MNSSDDIRTYVNKLIELSNQLEASPLDTDKLLEKLNLSLKIFSQDDLKEIEEADDIIDILRGILDYQKRKIYIREEDYNARMRFSIAHEIGHFLLPGHYEEFSKNNRILCVNNDFSSSTNILYEIEANKFAGDLLFKGNIAENMIKDRGPIDFNIINEFAQIFDVSIEATARYLIANSSFNQVIFFYDKSNPEKHPSIVSSESVENKLKSWTIKSIFEESMLRNQEKQDYPINAILYNKYRLTANVKVDDNNFCKKFILTIK